MKENKNSLNEIQKEKEENSSIVIQENKIENVDQLNEIKKEEQLFLQMKLKKIRKKTRIY